MTVLKKPVNGQLRVLGNRLIGGMILMMTDSRVMSADELWAFLRTSYDERGRALESAVKSRRCVVGESPIQGRISDPP